MSQFIELSDDILREARLATETTKRSIAGQIEYWAQLGRTIERLLEGSRALELRRAGDVRPLSDCLASVESDEGRRRVAANLDSQPFPHYEPAPNAPGLLIRVDADGTRMLGKFVGHQFRSLE